MTKEQMEQLLERYGVAFTGSLAEKLMEVIKSEQQKAVAIGYAGGYEQAMKEMLEPYDSESIEDLIQNVKNKAYDNVIKYVNTPEFTAEWVNCPRDVTFGGYMSGLIEKLKESNND